MKKNNLKTCVELLVVCVISFAFIFAGNSFCEYEPLGYQEINVESAKVIRVVETKTESINGMDNTVIIFEAKILSGSHKGEVIVMEQLINEVTIDKPVPVEEHDRVLVSNTDLMSNSVGESQWYYLQQNRIPGMICLGALFLILLLIIGRWKGLTTIVALGFTGAAVFMVYFPAILSGKNIYITTIIITIYIIISSLLLLNGFNKKTLCAIIGNLGGIIVAGVLAIISNHALKVTGMVDEGFIYLIAASEEGALDLRAIVWSCIIIGSLGAIMDVSMSIASAMQELAYEMKDPTYKRMIASGMNIGRDAIGTMTITLVLAYAGSSIASILLFTLNNRNMLILMNFEMIVVEIIQAIVGSLGILLAVPITVVFAAWIFNKRKVA